MLAQRFGQLPARRGHDKNRGADPGDRRLSRGLGDLREEPPASVGGLRYELRVSRLAHRGRVWVAAETTAQQTVLCLAHFQRRLGGGDKRRTPRGSPTLGSGLKGRAISHRAAASP